MFTGVANAPLFGKVLSDAQRKRNNEFSCIEMGVRY